MVGAVWTLLEGLGCADLLSLRPSTKDVVVSQKEVSNIDPNILFSLLQDRPQNPSFGETRICRKWGAFKHGALSEFNGLFSGPLRAFSELLRLIQVRLGRVRLGCSGWVRSG